MAKKALITGITGMVGSHLCDFLLENTDWDIYGVCRWRSPLDNVSHLLEMANKKDRIFFEYADLNDQTSLLTVLQNVNPILMSQERKKRFNSRLMLFFTGISRTSSDIAEKQVKSTKDKSGQLSQMQSLVSDACRVLNSESEDLDDFGKMLHETWMLKRSLTEKISNPLIDEIYQTAMDNGALGGKILGAGGGGFIMFYADPEKQKAIRDALMNLIYVPFKFDDQGCQIVYYAPKEYDPSTYQKLDFIHMQNKSDGVKLKP